MPEAPVEVHGNMGAGEHQISGPLHIRHRSPRNQEASAKPVHG
jgi:hypothetical protein